MAVRPRIIRLSAFVGVLLLVAPPGAEAQAGKVVRIGVLGSGGPIEPGNPLIAALRQGLHESGHVDGQNVLLESRSAEGRPARLPGLAAELVRLKVDVIVSIGDASTTEAQKATASIPIVMFAVSDPVARGFVASLARPGGNITGLTIQSPDLVGKTLELLKEAIPNLSRVAVLWDPGSPGNRGSLGEMETAARVLHVHLQLVEVQSAGEFESAFDAATRNGAGAVFNLGSPMLFSQRARIAELALKRRLPTICVLREYVDTGCLMGYGASLTDLFRRAAYFVDRILKGAKPADLPVEQPTRFYFVINLKTAKALGLSIPQPLLLRADHVIQ